MAWRDIGDVDGIAETGVGVGDDRGILHFANRVHHLQADVHREDTDIGHGVGRGQLKPATPYRIVGHGAVMARWTLPIEK
jgi:hypothetical protein